MSTVKKSYNEEDIEAALADIEEKNTSIRKAAFKVWHSILNFNR